MAVVFAESFDSYNATGTAITGAARRWSMGSAAALSTSNVAGRFGGRAQYFLHSNTAAWTQGPTFTSLSSLTLTLSYYAFYSSTTVGTATGIRLQNGATTQLSFRTIAGTVANTARLEVYRGLRTTLLGTTADFESGEWTSMEIEVVISDTVGRVTIYVNDVQIINLTSIDTNNSGGVVTQLWFGESGTSGTNYAVDDILVHDSATRPSEFYYGQTVTVDADGTTLDWTPLSGTAHYAMVDDLPAGTTDYNSASVVGDTDELLVAALPTSPASIICAQAVALALKTDGTARNIALGVDSNGTVLAGTSTALSTSGTYVNNLMNTDPSGSIAWTAAAIAGLKLLPEVTV